jgi:hypothetical protein
MGIWTHLIFEAFCRYPYSKDKYVRYLRVLQDTKGKLILDKNGNFKTRKLPKRLNPDYNPKDKRPAWCKRKNKKLKPQPHCYGADCPFLMMGPVTKKEYSAMVTAWEKTIKK